MWGQWLRPYFNVNTQSTCDLLYALLESQKEFPYLLSPVYFASPGPVFWVMFPYRVSAVYYQITRVLAAQPPPQTCVCWSLSPELINSLTSKNWESEGSQHYWCLFFWLLLLSLHSWESAGAFSFWRYFPTSWQYSQLGFFSAVSPARTSTDKCYHWLYWHGPQRDIRWRHFWNSSP